MNDDELFQDLDDLEINALSQDEMDHEEITDPEPFLNDEQPDLITSLLQDRGINDLNSIQFEDEDGVVRSRAWGDLTLDELRLILNQSYDYDPDTEPDDEEIDFLNYLRDNNLTPSLYVLMLKEQSPQVVHLEPVLTYIVDDFSDEELFVLDLQAKSDEITDEEALQALETAKLNPDLWEKQMAGIRKEYKTLEDNKLEEERLQQEEAANQEYNLFSNNIVEEINNLHAFGDLDITLEDEDKEELAEFILGRDQTGVSHLGKVLNDPEALVLMAWFALHGEDTFNEINRYMTEQLRRSAQQAYLKGLSDGKGGGRVTIRQKNNHNQGDSLDDINF